MKRRQFVSLLGGAVVAWCVPAWSQSAPTRRVGVLMNGAATEGELQSHVASFAQGLQQLGWIEGQNVRIDVRWNAGDVALARAYTSELIGLTPDVLLTASTTNLSIIQQATSTVPVVFVSVSDPVEQGFVASVTKPGGNLTGFSMFEFSIGGKWLNLLKEISPSLSRVGIIFNPDTSPQSKFFVRAIEFAAQSLNLKAIALPVRATPEIESAVERFAREPNGGLVQPTDSFMRLRQKLLAELAARHRLPVIAGHETFPKDGGLMYYGASVNLREQFRQAAGYVDRILRGAKPADLPVQRADKYTFILNLKTAKTLGLSVPIPLLGLADEVIE